MKIARVGYCVMNAYISNTPLPVGFEPLTLAIVVPYSAPQSLGKSTSCSEQEARGHALRRHRKLRSNRPFDHWTRIINGQAKTQCALISVRIHTLHFLLNMHISIRAYIKHSYSIL